MPRSFKAKLESCGPGGAWTMMDVPFDVEEVFGSRARVSVVGTLNGFPFRSSIFPDGAGRHRMMVNKAMRAGARAEPGDVVRVTIDLDAAPRTVAVPKDLKAALAKDKAARSAFEGLSYSHRKEFVDWIEQAKRPETRAARVTKTLSMALGRTRVKA